VKILDTVLSIGEQFGLVKHAPPRPIMGQPIRRYYSQRDPNWPTAKMSLQNNPLSMPFTQHAWVHAAVDAIASRCGSVIYRLIVNNNTELESGPVYESFSRPNPESSPSQMWYLTACHLMLGGNAFWVLERSAPTKAPTRMWVYGRDRFKPIWAEKERTLKGWEFRNPNTSGGFDTTVLKPYQVVWFPLPSPDSDFWGVAPLEAARGSAEQDWLANVFNRNFFENAATPGGVLKIRRPLTDKQREQYRLQFDARYQGADKAFRTVLVEGDADYLPFGYTHTDMKFCEQKRMSREEICAVFKVPPAVVGIFEQVHKATAKEVNKSFWEGTIKPILNLFEDVMRSQFWMGYDNERTWGRFDLSNVEALQEDRDTKWDRVIKACSVGVPFNVANQREALGYDEIEGGDVGFLPANVVPIMDVIEPPEKPIMITLPPQPPKPGIEAPKPGESKPDEKPGTTPEPPPTPEKPAKAPETAIQRAVPTAEAPPTEAPAEQPEATPEALPASPDETGPETAEKAPEAPQPAVISRVAIVTYGSPEHEARWKAVVTRTASQEKAYQQKLRGWFTRLKAWYAAKFADAAERYHTLGNLPQDVLSLPSEITNDLSNFSLAHYERVVESMKPVLEAELKPLADLYTFDPAKQSVRSFIIGKQIKVVQDVCGNLDEKVREKLLAGQAENLTVQELAADIATVIGDKKSRALTIARTETGQIASGVQALEYAAIGVKHIQWISALDEHVRDTHRSNMEEGPHEFGVPFPNGLRWPCDERGDASEICNCRCSWGMLD
jgi:HK97 family phage portal protein